MSVPLWRCGVSVALWRCGVSVPLWRCLEVVSISCTHRALAINCHAPFNDKEGAESKDWKKGKPVRVVCPSP